MGLVHLVHLVTLHAAFATIAAAQDASAYTYLLRSRLALCVNAPRWNPESTALALFAADCTAEIAEAQKNDKAAEAGLEAANAAFNTTLKTADTAVSIAVKAHDTADTALVSVRPWRAHRRPSAR